MTESNDFILGRAIATRAAQDTIAATWVWDEHTVAEWDADIAAFIAQKELATDKEAIKTADAGTLDAQLDVLHSRTQVSLALFKVKNRDNPAMTHVLKPLKAEGGSRDSILEEALDFESAWEKWDPTWLPKPTETLASFKTLREECIDLRVPYASSKGVWRKEAEDYNQLGIALNKLCKAWYEAATALFREGTAEGDMIRGTVPTTYSPSDVPLPGPAEITLQGTDPGLYLLGLSAEDDDESVTGYDVFERFEGGAWVKVGDNVPGGDFSRTGLAAGDYEVKAQARNATGVGPESDMLSLTVP